MSVLDRRRACLVSFLVFFLAIVVAAGLRDAAGRRGVGVVLEDGKGGARTIRLAAMKRLPLLTRAGTYENQFGNWRDPGVYTGVRLTDLLGLAADYASILVVARDGYSLEIPRERLEDSDYPLVFAYAFNGVEVPAWTDGFRLAILPEDGAVSNDEYGAPSAGAFWVRHVTKITLKPPPAP